MSLADAASDANAIFTIDPQPAYGAAIPKPSTTPVWFANQPATATATSANLTAAPARTAPLLSYCHIRW